VPWRIDYGDPVVLRCRACTDCWERRVDWRQRALAAEAHNASLAAFFREALTGRPDGTEYNADLSDGGRLEDVARRRGLLVLPADCPAARRITCQECGGVGQCACCVDGTLAMGNCPGWWDGKCGCLRMQPWLEVQR
jgi:hypothetical protein